MQENTKKILGIHLGLLVAEGVCISAFVLEVGRARSGNALSWAYVVEWPIFALYALYMWRKLLSGEPARPVDDTSEEAGPDEPRLAAYNEYLRSVHAPGSANPPSQD